MENHTPAKGKVVSTQQAAVKKSTGAFTLVEMLATMMIVAILVVMLFGGTRYVLESAKTVTCMSNLRTIGIGFATFAAENNSLFPNASQGGYWPGTIAEYVPRKTFFCPSEDKAAMANKVDRDDKAWKENQPFISYGYNGRYLAPDFGSTWSVPRPRDNITFTRLARMKSVMVLADAGRLNSSGTSGWGFYYMEPPQLQYGMPLPRHRGHANVLWADGSVSQRECILGKEDPYKYITKENWDWRLQ